MQLSMTGRTALVTGASFGIGRAIAQAFAGAGASVALVARRDGPLQEAATAIAAASGAKTVAIAADVSTADECERIFNEAQSALGQVDVLVNNAGSSARGPFESVTDEQWQADLDLKLFAAIRLARLALPKMKERHFGRIINILNTGAKAPPAQGAPTAVSRAAGMALTKVLAAEGAPHNVLVNALLVGKIESDQWVRRHAASHSNESLEAYYARMGEGLPMGRVGTAQEFAAMACFLASDAGSYVTGTAINVDGGACPVV
ncbi:MAG: SDR family oxidoreductase [Gammaproteobacteria bacterium]|nr:SDR family oxidoreductase [Gammaproteobacteria bacterium]